MIWDVKVVDTFCDLYRFVGTSHTASHADEAMKVKYCYADRNKTVGY